MQGTFGAASARWLAWLPWLASLALACERGAAVDDDWRGARLTEPIQRVDFTLLDTNGEPFDFRAETEDALTLLFFGYTYCPDVCPVHMTNLAAVLQRFPYELRNRVRVVFVSTDPERDTPQRIREWLDHFDRSFVGLRGSSEEIDAIQDALRLPRAQRGQARPDGSYDVGHAAAILAFEPGGPARFMYPFGTRQADWQHDLPRLLRDPAP